MPKLFVDEAPPIDYYATNLLTLIKDVENQYVAILNCAELDFARRVYSLDADSVRLYARLVSRTRPLLRLTKLRYTEVRSRSDAMAELVAVGLVHWCPATDLNDLLDGWSMVELLHLFPEIKPIKPKSDYVHQVIDHFEFDSVVTRLQEHDPWVVLNFAELLVLYQLLFFGDPYQGLSTFVLHDLGRLRFEKYQLPAKRRLFADRFALDSYLDLLRVTEIVRDLGPCPDRSAGALLPCLWHKSAHRLLERRRSRTLNRLARGFERAGNFDAALSGYSRSSLAPARERKVRILNKLGDVEAAKELATEMVRRPWTTLEAEFAYRSNKISVPNQPIPQTDVPLFGSQPDSIEHHALGQLTKCLGTGWHLENQFPMGLFALAFWDWIYAPIDGVFVNAFQSGPIDLFWPDFFSARQPRCEDPLQHIDLLSEKLLRTHHDKNGITNRLINWSVLTQPRLERIVEVIDPVILCQVLSIVREGLEEARAGFPDLTVLYEPGRFEFVEVKGPGDRVQNNQKLWIRRLLERDIPVRVMRFSVT